MAYGGTGDSSQTFFTVQEFLNGYARCQEVSARLLGNYDKADAESSSKKKKQRLTTKVADKINRLIWSTWGAFRHPLIFQDVEYNWENVLLVPPIMHNFGHLSINIIQVLVQKYSTSKPLKKLVGLLVNTQNVVKVHGTFAKARSKLSLVADHMLQTEGFQDFDRKVVELSSTLCHIVYSVNTASAVYSLQLWLYGFLCWIFFHLNPVMIDKKKVSLAANVYMQVFLFLSVYFFLLDVIL